MANPQLNHKQPSQQELQNMLVAYNAGHLPQALVVRVFPGNIRCSRCSLCSRTKFTVPNQKHMTEVGFEPTPEDWCLKPAP